MTIPVKEFAARNLVVPFLTLPGVIIGGIIAGFFYLTDILSFEPAGCFSFSSFRSSVILIKKE